VFTDHQHTAVEPRLQAILDARADVVS
jgi:hypothetical protein